MVAWLVGWLDLFNERTELSANNSELRSCVKFEVAVPIKSAGFCGRKANNMNSLIIKAVQDFITQSGRFVME